MKLLKLEANKKDRFYTNNLGSAEIHTGSSWI